MQWGTSSVMNVPVIREFEDVFLEELLGLPPVRDRDFAISWSQVPPQYPKHRTILLWPS